MHPLCKHHPAPSASVQRSFGPYSRHELQAARSQLIQDLYNPLPNPGGILTRVKLKCGILSDSRGLFSGCEPHPETKVSFESQSCDLMAQDGNPWMREDGEQPSSHTDNMYERTEQRYLSQGRIEENHSLNSNGRLCNSPPTSLNSDNYERDFDYSRYETEPNSQGAKRKFEEEDTRGVGCHVDKKLRESTSPRTSISPEPLPREQRDYSIWCFSCDVCGVTVIREDSIVDHLKERHHSSASQYRGIYEGGKLVPKYLVKKMAFQNKPGQFSSTVLRCPECYISFSDFQTYSVHYNTIHRYSGYPRYMV